MNWTRALLGGLLAEILVILLIAPVVLIVGVDTLSDPSTLPPLMGYSIVAASFLAPLVMTQWVVKKAPLRFVLHGLLVGFAAFLIYMIPVTLSGGSQPAIYWLAHAAKIAGGLSGGIIAARRHSARAAVMPV